MIRVGYTKTDNTDVLHGEYENTTEANTAIFELRGNSSGDDSIDYFYLQTQLTDVEWEKYGYVDPLQINRTSSIMTLIYTEV